MSQFAPYIKRNGTRQGDNWDIPKSACHLKILSLSYPWREMMVGRGGGGGHRILYTLQLSYIIYSIGAWGHAPLGNFEF